MPRNTILESIGDAIYSVGPDWCVTYFNGEAERFAARDRTDILGRSLWECFPAAADSEIGRAIRQVMTTRSATAMVTLSPSTKRWVDTRIFPLEDGGVGVGWRDITSQKQQETALAEARQSQDRLLRELRAVTDNLPAMIASWDVDLKCRFANAQYLRWFGRSSEEMIGISIQDLMGEALFAQNEPHIRRALAGERQEFERTLRKATGEVGHTWAQYVPYKDPHGQVLGFYALVTDITPLKEAEERLKQANAELKAAREEAEAAAAVKGAFLSNMSHELRNPLTSIIGYADLLARRGDFGELESKYLARIQDASEALLTTVNDVLDFSKLEAGQVEIEDRVVDPLAVGLHALGMFEPEMEKKGLFHRFEAQDLPARVRVDDTRLRQILTNLIGNAVKFTTSGGVTVRCLYDSAHQVLRFEVVDTGPGIPAEQQSRLFRRFSQVDASTTRRFGGTGLGLAICKGLAEAMGGQVGLLSMPGEGSCFWVEVPCRAVKAQEGRLDVPADILPDPDALRGQRLLVVDDVAANRELVRLIVEPFGVEVVEAASGSEAVSAARSRDFDVMLIDIRMPEIDGPTAAQIIRAQPGRNAATPIFAFTADMAGEMPKAWSPLFDGLLLKPIVSEDLLRLLARCRRGVSPAPA